MHKNAQKCGRKGVALWCVDAKATKTHKNAQNAHKCTKVWPYVAIHRYELWIMYVWFVFKMMYVWIQNDVRMNYEWCTYDLYVYVYEHVLYMGVCTNERRHVSPNIYHHIWGYARTKVHLFVHIQMCTCSYSMCIWVYARTKIGPRTWRYKTMNTRKEK